MSLVKNIILATVAFILALLFMPVGFFYALVFLIFRLDKTLTLKYFSRLFFNIALTIDILGNYVCAVLFNAILIKKNASMYHFGKQNETISYALGKNLIANNLTIFGKILCAILDYIDKDHCLKALK